MVQDHSLSLLDRFFVKFSTKWYLVDITDSYVVYEGTYDECEELQDQLHGALYVTMRKRDLNKEERKSLDFLRHT
jgi:hypothetical protein